MGDVTNFKSKDYPRKSWVELELQFVAELIKSFALSANCPPCEASIKQVVAVYLEDLTDVDPDDCLQAVMEIRRGDWEFGGNSRWLKSPMGGPYAPRIAEIREIAKIKSEIRDKKRPSLPPTRAS